MRPMVATDLMACGDQCARQEQTPLSAPLPSAMLGGHSSKREAVAGVMSWSLCL